MPEHFKTKELGEKIGEKIGTVKEVGIFTMKGKESRVVKVKVILDATKVLRGKMKIASPNKKIIELNLRFLLLLLQSSRT